MKFFNLGLLAVLAVTGIANADTKAAMGICKEMGNINDFDNEKVCLQTLKPTVVAGQDQVPFFSENALADCKLMADKNFMKAANDCLGIIRNVNVSDEIAAEAQTQINQPNPQTIKANEILRAAVPAVITRTEAVDPRDIKIAELEIDMKIVSSQVRQIHEQIKLGNFSIADYLLEKLNKEFKQ